ncbi:MAG TPA: PAS domain S-box protein, partial [Thermoanaerobaculia bacterium]
MYALIGLLWIVLSDVLVAKLGPAGRSLQTVKGGLFIVVSALAIYLLLARRRIIPARDLDALARDAAESERLGRSLAEVRAAQNALAQSEARLRRLIDMSLDAIVTISTDGLILDWNDEAERMFGWTRKDAIGENFEPLIVPAARREPYNRTLKQIGEAGAAAISMRRFETSAMDRLDREFPVELTVAPVEMGDRIVVTLFMRDISDRARAEREARLIQAIVNAAPFAIISVDGDARILSWNPAAEKMYGWRAADVRGSSIAMLFPRDSADLPPLVERVRLGVAVDAEQGAQIRRDGRLITVVRTLVPLEAPANGPRQAALLCADLSEQQQLERRLSDAEYLASLGRLAGTVAHEFNNVLMGIQSFSELIARRAAEDQKVGSAVNQIRLSVQRGRRITEDILR